MPAAPTPASRSKPAALGGTPVRAQRFPSWPVFDQKEEEALLEALRSGRWFRGNGKNVAKFEGAYAKLTGAKHCLATANGTSALFISLNALGVEPGDEVLVPPYTFVATVNVVLRQHALPVFFDSDVDTNRCPANDRLCEEAVWLTQNMLLGPRSDMDQIAEAILKIQEHAGALARD